MKVEALEHVVDSIYLVCKTKDKPKVEVLKDIDGINVKLTAQCMKCDATCVLEAAGVPDSVQDFMTIPKNSHVAILLHRMDSNGALQVDHHSIIPEADAQIFAKVHKYQTEQFVMHMKSSRSEEMCKERKKEIDDLFLSQRTPKRLKISKTLDGDEL